MPDGTAKRPHEEMASDSRRISLSCLTFAAILPTLMLARTNSGQRSVLEFLSV